MIASVPRAVAAQQQSLPQEAFSFPLIQTWMI